ncbi:uncharacterized protein LOC110807916 isoform X2 [Carica papaya]|uniref:uncharacterized protein LOC110807916 isoform X2 n=1 Tax=Carica papaya TaxID=3649 RepID=UPI000B8C8779|nr:uncharacterized protein LOC110807916 isoform X2 [Carica papaya]
MDGQDQRKNHFAGSENHGVHVCSKCGWAFANSHPSAKQRRAHKKICGKPKGYQRVDSGEGGSAHGVVSDDEHFSDEDYKTPSPKVVDKSNNVKAISETGGTQNKLLDEVLRDSVVEFSPGVEEKTKGNTELAVERSAKNDQDAVQSLEDIDTSQQIKRFDSGCTESTTTFVGIETDSRENEDIKLESCQVDVVPSEVVSEKAKEITSDSVSIDECIRSNKEHVDHANTLIDAAQTMTYEAPGTDFSTSINSIEGYNGNKEANENVIMLSVPDDVPVVDQAGLMVEDFEDHKGVKLCKSLLVDSCETIRDEGGETKNPNNENGTNIHSGELSEHIEVSASGMHVLEDDCKHEGGNDKAVVNEGNESAIYHFGGPSEGIGVYSSGMHGLEYDHNHEGWSDKPVIDEGSDSVIVLSVPDDVPVDDHAEVMLEDFKNHKGVKLEQFLLVDSCETIEYTKGGKDAPDNEKVITSVYSGKQSESSEVSASVLHVSEGGHKHEGGNDKLVVNEGNKNEIVLSVPYDVPVADHTELMLKNFIDHKEKVGLSLLLDSWATNAPGNKNVSSVPYGKPSEGTKVSAPVMHVVGDGHKHEHGDDDHMANEGNKNVIVLSVLDDVPEVDHAELMLEDFKDHNRVKLDQSLSVDECETIKDGKGEAEAPNNENVSSVYSGEPSEGSQVSASVMHVSEDDHKNGGANDKLMNKEGNKNMSLLSVPNGAPVADHNELLLKDFKEHKGVELPQSISVDSCETIEDSEGETKAPEGENVPCVHSGELSEDNEVFSSVMLMLENDHKHEGGNADLMVKKLGVVKGLDEEAAQDDAYTIEIKKGKEILCLLEGQQTYDICDNSLQKGSSETVMEVLPDTGAEVNLITNFPNTDNSGSHEMAGVEICDTVKHDDGKTFEGETGAESKISCSLSLSEVNPSSDMLNVNNGDDAGDCGKYMIEKSDVARVKSQTVPEDLDGVSDITLDFREDLVDSKGRDQANADFINMATELRCHEDDLLQKSHAEAMTKGPRLFSSDAEPSISSSAAVEDNRTREFGGDAFGFCSQPTQCKDDNGFFKYQHGTYPTDLSIDSNSQTDSVEANWGSVSVLSLQSDTLTAIDAETEKANSEKPKGGYEGQQSDKSDVFEPPSFMTLVEPRGEDHHKVAGSEMQADQKPHQPKASVLQAGWFPSLTNVVNESQGRKKNEEIIAKVTNWSTGKHHAPLKNLLGEASNEARPRSLDMMEYRVPLIQKGEDSAREATSLSAPKVISIMGRESSAEPGKREMVGEEWNSPARYPTDIKREKRKVKGRSYWVQFVCCSSRN